MTGFSVDIDEMNSFWSVLDRIQERIAVIPDHVKKYAVVDERGDGELINLGAAHDHIFDTSRSWFARLEEFTALAAADRISDTIDAYMDADFQTLRDVDAAMEGLYEVQPPVNASIDFFKRSSDRGWTDFGDIYPDSYLRAPADYESQFKPIEEFGWADWFSPSHWAVEAIRECSALLASLGIGREIDPWNEWLQPLTGNWLQLREAAEVWGQIGSYCSAESMNLLHFRVRVHQIWDGHAAGRFQQFMHGWHVVMNDAAAVFNATEQNYISAAEGAWNTKQTVEALIKQLADALIIAAAAAVGGPLGLAVALVHATRIWKLMDQITTHLGNFVMVVDGSNAILHDFGMVDGSVLSLPEVPQP